MEIICVLTAEFLIVEKVKQLMLQLITNTTKAKTDVQMKMLKVEVSLNVGDRWS